jgi:CRP-like cAMP-binding protein
MRAAPKAADPEVLAAFQQAPVLSALARPAREALATRSKVVSLATHDVLWREGDLSLHLGVVLHGRVAIERARQRRLIVDVAGAHELVGEIAFSLGARYQFDVRCLRKARVALVPVKELRKVCDATPRASQALSSALAEEVLRLCRRLEALSAGNVGQRLARVLLMLTERFGTPFPGGVLMPVRLRREDLAALSATTLESASRQISAWKRQGLVVPQPAGFLVKDVEALRGLGSEAELSLTRP